MKVLVACEFSGRVRDAFRQHGFDAYSCDLLEADDHSPYHIVGDVLEVLAATRGIDLMIAHPPCRYLAVSGARWFSERQQEQKDALEFVQTLMDSDVPQIAIENPVSVISTQIRKPDQIIQPYYFGDPFKKTTCLWLKGLPLLKRTSSLTDGVGAIHNFPDSLGRSKRRSITYPGFATAMATQWGVVQ